MAIDFPFMYEHVGDILKGVPTTLLIAVISTVFGLVIGTIFALIRKRKLPVINQLIVVFVSFFRSTPLIVQLFAFYYGTPIIIEWLNNVLQTDLDPDGAHPLMIVLFVFTLHSAAYLTEVMRSGLKSVDESQIEAAVTVGLKRRHILTRIVIPQAIGYAIPNLGNQFIALIKGTAIAFVVQVTEILAISQIIANDGYRFVEVYIIASAIYWMMALVFEWIFGKMESRVGKYLYQT
ncbi:amino acid ABC transporter permease [Mammaliicoccus vitulinus]|uniref:amino acid ABC transporter permease n=1 Tax=Mammaliicoccus vitulinus TaxID=71237 RepID=UPI00217507EF|nr:amino acid ABC transporter permease [Mammaliicoccus vitulinus]